MNGMLGRLLHKPLEVAAIVTSIAVAVVNLLVEISYALLNPKVRT